MTGGSRTVVRLRLGQLDGHAASQMVGLRPGDFCGLLSRGSQVRVLPGVPNSSGPFFTEKGAFFVGIPLDCSLRSRCAGPGQKRSETAAKRPNAAPKVSGKVSSSGAPASSEPSLWRVRADGTEELVALEDGDRESEESWASVLRDPRGHGLRALAVAIGGRRAPATGRRAPRPDRPEDHRRRRIRVHRAADRERGPTVRGDRERAAYTTTAGSKGRSRSPAAGVDGGVVTVAARRYATAPRTWPAADPGESCGSICIRRRKSNAGTAPSCRASSTCCERGRAGWRSASERRTARKRTAEHIAGARRGQRRRRPGRCLDLRRLGRGGPRCRAVSASREAARLG